jgi:hypothetical protein
MSSLTTHKGVMVGKSIHRPYLIKNADQTADPLFF